MQSAGFALFGIILGSFLNVCIDRIPRGKSLLMGRSHCDTCGRSLAILDLIPIASYLWLRGRCRYCGARIPPRVPAVEILINTAAVAENVRSTEKSLNIPDLIAEGSISYRMQSFDQSLMAWYKAGVISYEAALHYATNPSEFGLRAAGVTTASDRTFADPESLSAEVPGLSRNVAP